MSELISTTKCEEPDPSPSEGSPSPLTGTLKKVILMIITLIIISLEPILEFNHFMKITGTSSKKIINPLLSTERFIKHFFTNKSSPQEP